MQLRHKIKESLEWIVYDGNGSPVAACRDSETADNIKPDHGFVYHHDDPPPTPRIHLTGDWNAYDNDGQFLGDFSNMDAAIYAVSVHSNNPTQGAVHHRTDDIQPVPGQFPETR